MSPAEFLALCAAVALALLALSLALLVLRLILGPALADRILALDLIFTLGIGFIAVVGVKTGYHLYVDIAIALGLVGFLATIAFARFVAVRGEGDGAAEEGR